MNTMHKAGKIVIVASLSMLALIVGVYAAETKSVTNGDWEITWGGGAASARNAKAGDEKLLFESTVAKEEGDGQTTNQMLSVVGTIISYANSWYSEGGAHPSYGTIWSAVNLDPNKSASLADLFGEEAVFSRLMHDVNIQSALNGVYTDTGDQQHPTPKNLGELLRLVDGGCNMSMGVGMLEEYYFRYRLGGKVAVVQIGLSHGCEVNRGDFTELAMLYFPIPDALMADFDKAVRDGVLEDKPFQEPSYDCNKAESVIEFALCTDPALAKLDVAMGKKYGELRRTLKGDAKAGLRDDQRNWITVRNTECWDGAPDCLREFYAERLKYMEASGAQ